MISLIILELSNFDSYFMIAQGLCISFIFAHLFMWVINNFCAASNNTNAKNIPQAEQIFAHKKLLLHDLYL